MKITQFSYFCVIFVALSCDADHFEGLTSEYVTKKSKCLNPPRTARRVEIFIRECQEEVKTKLINEAFQILKTEVSQEHPPLEPNDDSVQFIDDYHEASSHGQYSTYTLHSTHDIHADTDNSAKHSKQHVYESSSPKQRITHLMHRIRRMGDISNGIYHPTLVPFEDKRIAGCLLHCVYAKNHAIDKIGWPTLDGLVNFYSEGVNEHGFFMATLRSVNLCLRAVTNKYHVDRRKLPEKGESCDLAFDVFDCISDQITGYCLDHYKH